MGESKIHYIIFKVFQEDSRRRCSCKKNIVEDLFHSLSPGIGESYEASWKGPQLN